MQRGPPVAGQFSRTRLWRASTHGRIGLVNRLAQLSAAVAAVSLLVAPQTAAEPADTVGTAVHVVIQSPFEATQDADQCVGAAMLGAVRRGSSVVLSEGSASPDAPKVAVGQFYRSRLKDGVCEALYITSAPVMPAFNVQFADPAGAASPTFGPYPSESVTDQPGILQAVRVDIALVPQP